ncbi:DUF6308 family protein [Streptomyces sp. NPDC047024]|uniref:DUF6308 family protein n=1 Tax=Streptomyces sp. NPDC047024 TaxID=3155476 RepID=UPI003403C100
MSGLVSSGQAVSDLRRYFGIGLEEGQLPYTGSRFEHLSGGGDRASVADVVTADDLIAVQTLSVRVPVQVAVDLLEGDLGSRLSGYLRKIPGDVDLARADAAELKPGSAAHEAWRLLCEQTGVKWVVAGKLLARKRPRLLPVYDQVVRCVLGHPASFWLDLHAALRADGFALQQELLALRKCAEIPDTVSALRVCDVVLWMRHHERHRSTGCAGV